MKKQNSQLAVIFFLTLILTVFPLQADNYCLDFDGFNDFVEVNEVLPDTGTIELWYYPENFYDHNTILDNSTDPDNWEMWIYSFGILRFRIGYGDVSCDLNSLNGPMSWYHIAIMWEKKDTLVDYYLYVNGELKDSTFNKNWVDPGSSFYFGGGGGNTSGDGQIDEIRIWDVVRTESEINDDMYRILTGSETGLALYYKLDESSGNIANNSASNSGSSGNVNGATITYPGFPIFDNPFSGNITSDTTWSEDIGIIGDVTIEDGVTLTIDPGVTVTFSGENTLNVKGRLLAEGTITDSIFFTSYNQDIGWGGIYFSYQSVPNDTSKISFCKIEQYMTNDGGIGGAIRIFGFNNLIISNNTITNNHNNYPNGAAGGIFLSSSSPIIINNLISNNSAGGSGGGLCIGNSSFPIFNNNIIEGNSANNGGGIHLTNSEMEWEMSNNTISNNSATGSGGGIYHSYDNNVNILNSIFWGNTAPEGSNLRSNGGNITFDYCNIEETPNSFFLYQGATITLNNCTSSNPMFNNNDYSLDYRSPCINAGDPATVLSGVDFAGNNRKFISDYTIDGTNDEVFDRIDIGAYEYSSETGSFPLDYTFTENRSLTNPILIPNGKTLTVNPNITLSFAQNDYLYMVGKLTAEGTLTEKIKFTATNTSNGWGGLKFDNPIESSSSILEHCIVEYGKNTGDNGGNISVKECDSLIIRNSYLTNGYAEKGGAVYSENSSVKIIGSVLTDNEASLSGGAIFIESGTPALTNLTITNNSAAQGGALGCDTGADVTVRNSIFWDNGTTEIEGTVSDIQNSTIEGGYSGNGNSEIDPMFTGTANDPYQTALSFCLNSGMENTTGLELPNTDILGNDRIYDQPGYSRIDMGAYEYQGYAAPTNCQASDGSNDFNGFVNISWDFNLDYTPLEGFKIHRIGSSNNPIGVVNNTQLFFQDITAVPGVVYSYFVESYFATESANSNEDSGYLKPNGIITGTVKTSNDNPVQGVKLSLDPSPGYCLEFDGSTNLTITDPEVLFDYDFTLEVWVKTIQSNVNILSRGILDLKINSSGNVELTDGTNTFTQTLGDISADDGEWHHIAISRTEVDDTVIMYLDSLEVGTQSSFNFQAGITGDFVSDASFVGFLDDIRVWNVERDSTQIADGRNIIISTEEVGLEGYWPFNEGTGGIAFDATNYAHNGSLDNPIWSDAEPGVLLGAFTNEWGQYSITQISYGTATTFDVTPSKPGHNFQPEMRQVTLSESNIAQDGVDFTDNSLIPISGIIKYMDTECPVEGVSIFVNGELALPPIYTDETGYFVLEVEHGSECLISADYQNHSFNRSWDLGTVTTPQSGKDFADVTKDRFRLEVVGGNVHWPIGAFDVTINSVNGYVNLDIPAGSNFWGSGGIMVDNIPPLVYNVTVNPEYGADPFGLEVNEYFQSIKTDTVSFDFDNLTIDTLRFVWKNDLQASVTWPEEITVSPDTLGNTIYVVELHHFNEYPEAEFYVLPQNEWCTIEIRAFEDYNFGNFTDHYSYLDDCDIEITDEVGTQGVIETGFTDTTIYTHRFAPYVPNILTGTERQYQNMMQVIISDEESNRTSTITNYVLIEGIRPLEDTYATISPELPLLVLHDPPGDGSFASFNEMSSLSNSWSTSVCTNQELNLFANIHLGPDISFEAGTPFFSKETEIDVTIDLDYGFTVGVEQSNTHEQKQTWTTSEEYTTSNDDQVIGAGADLFVGGAMNLIYGITLEVEWDADSNKVDLETGVMVSPKGFATTYIYTANQIENTVIPNLMAISDTSSAELWQSYLDTNEGNKNNAELDRNISFNAGAGYMHSDEHSITTTNTIVFEQTVSHEFGLKLGVTVDGIGGEAGFVFKTGFKFGDSQAEEVTQTTTTSYTLADNDETSDLNDLADYFSVDVKIDPIYGTPVFDLVAGASSAPWEENTLPREGVFFSANTYSASNLLEGEIAAFNLNLGNTSQSNNGAGEDRRYYLSVNQSTNQGGATIKINGVAIEDNMPFDIPGGEMLQAVMTVEQGPTAYEYEDISIRFGSAYDSGPMDTTNTHFFSMEKEFTITWETPYSKVNIAEPGEDFIVNQANNDLLDIKFIDYDIDRGDFESLKLQYKHPEGDTWFPAFEISRDSLISHPNYVVEPWDISMISDGAYQIRAVATDSILTPYYSEPVLGTIDRSSPIIFTTPEPADGILEAGDEISISFSEFIDPLSINNDSLSVRVVRTNMDVDVEVVCFENTISLTPLIANYWLENETVEVTISGVKDLNGNPMETAETWSFYVNRNPVSWNVTRIQAIKAIGEPLTLSAELFNGGGSLRSYVISDQADSIYYAGLQSQTPEWITVTPFEGQLLPLDTQELNFEISDQIGFGTYFTTLYAHTSMGNEAIEIEISVVSNPPAWAGTVLGNFDYSMTMTGKLFIDGFASVDINDIVGAFILDENGDYQCCGVSNVKHYPDLIEEYQVYMSIFNNLNDNQDILFRVWDASESKEYYGITDAYSFENGTFHGTPLSPVDLISMDTQVQDIPVSTGWSWISLNLEDSSDMSVNSILANLDPVDGDLIKEQAAAYSQYATGSGWIGTLNNLNTAKMYKLNLTNDGVIEHTGIMENPALTPITINNGWNWISYIPHVSISVNEAMSGFDNITSGDIIKSQMGFAQYIDDGSNSGWYGSLIFLNPGEGYMYYANNSGTLTYPGSYVSVNLNNNNFVAQPTELRDAPDWSVNYYEYEFSQNVTAEVFRTDTIIDSENVILGAFDTSGECRGYATPILFQDEYIFFLTVYSNDNNEDISFKVYFDDTDLIMNADEIILFSDNAILGSPSEPFVINTLINHVPNITTPIDNISTSEDFITPIIINLNNHFTDIDGDILGYDVSVNNTDEVLCNITDSILTISSVLNWNGITDITISANDRFGKLASKRKVNNIKVNNSISKKDNSKLTVETSFSVNISAVNDAPHLETVIDDLNIIEDFEPIVINLNDHFDDVDGDVLSYEILVNNSDEVVCDIVDNTLTITSVLNWNGSSQVTIEAEDGYRIVGAKTNKQKSNKKRIITNNSKKSTPNTRLTAQASFNVNVATQNDPPFVQNVIENINTEEDFTEAIVINLDDHFSDIDGDILSYEVTVNNSDEVACSIDENLLTISSVLNWNGTSDVTIKAEDGFEKFRSSKYNSKKSYRENKNGKLFAEASFSVIISSVNDAPVIVSFLPEETLIQVDIATELDFSILPDDVDNYFGELDFSWFIGTVNQNVNDTTFTFNVNQTGTFDVLAIVSDGFLSDSTSWTVQSTVGIDDEPNLPIVTKLYQNYPNPFNPVTTIKFDLATDSRVNIVIYNSKGEMVRSIVNNEMKQAGRYKFDFNANNLPSGIYYYELKAENGYSKIFKAMLVK